ncbi:MAG: IclR family transcriptional regulator [Ancalomicrobiaceae bacterium]|nr:IclR family transcriptional regulator [Ancalomicrobiaceae bacterium]
MSSTDMQTGDEGRKSEYRAPAAEKVLDILEFMASQPDSLTLTEISTGLGRSIQEIYRILLLLEKRGYLVRTRSDRIRLSLKLFELAHMHPPVNRLIERALPIMRDLTVNSDQSCHLAVPDGLKVMIALQVDSPLPMRYSVALGSRFPTMETSSGAVLVAWLPAPDRQALLARIVEAGEAYGSLLEIETRIEAIRDCGYEMRESLAVDACTNISLPIRDHTSAVIAALTVPFLPQRQARFDRQTVLQRTIEAAGRISAALGAPEQTL